MFIKYTILGLALFSLVGPLNAATIDAQVQDAKTGEFLGDAVVVAIPTDGAVVDASAFTDKGNQVMVDQIDKEFVKYVTPTYKGAKVFFPNHDVIRHHVYSFSDAKSFDIPLFKGTPAEPVLLDQAGEVTLGCNIHDWMKGFIYVADSPYFAQSDASGHAMIKDLPAGQYDIRVWHPNLRGNPDSTTQAVTVSSASENQTLTFQIKQKKVWKAWRAPAAAEGSYN